MAIRDIQEFTGNPAYWIPASSSWVDVGEWAHQGGADSRCPGFPAFSREDMLLRGWSRRYLSTMGPRGNAGRVHDKLRLSHEVRLRNRR